MQCHKLPIPIDDCKCATNMKVFDTKTTVGISGHLKYKLELVSESTKFWQDLKKKKLELKLIFQSTTVLNLEHTPSYISTFFCTN